MPTKMQAKLALDKALGNGGELDIHLMHEKDAISFRFLLYKARREVARALAKIDGIDESEVTTDYDDMTFKVIQKDGNWFVSIRTVKGDIRFLDPHTGMSV